MTLRKWLFWFHLVLGLAAGLVIMSMAVTGVLLAFEPQIVAYAERGLRTVPVPQPPVSKLTVSEVISRSKAWAPDAKLATIGFSADPQGSVTLGFGRDGGAYYVNPYTGSPLGKTSKTHDFLHSVEEWHRWLGSRKLGKPVTGAACLAFLGMALSGLWLWWPRHWNKRALRASIKPRWGLRGRARDWNWHNAFGFWFLPLILLVTTTGTVMSYRWAHVLLFRATGSEPPPPPAAADNRPKVDAGGVDRPSGRPALGAWIDSLPALASTQLPQWETLLLRLPNKDKAPLQVTLFHDAQGSFARRSNLTLDAASGALLKWEPYGSQSLGQRARLWVRYLHSGEAFGIAGQAVMALSALVSILLVWTGFAMAWRRFFRASP